MNVQRNANAGPREGPAFGLRAGAQWRKAAVTSGDRARREECSPVAPASFSYRNPKTGATRSYVLRINKQIGPNGNAY